MPRNSSGQYQKPAGTTAVTQTTISSSAFNALADDIATEITGSLPTDGTASMESGAQLKSDPGTVSVPGITFTGDLDSGLYSSGANKVAVAVGGVKVGEFDSTGLVEGVWTDTASASTVNIGAVNSRNIAITGTTTITAFDTVASGTYRRLKFAGALTLTHNGTSLILPGAANITTAAGDTAEFVSLGAGNWVCVDFQKASGLPVVNPTVGPTLMTSQASTSGTSIDFTSIPTGVKRIMVGLVGVSTNGTTQVRIQIGSGSVTATGYLGSADAAVASVVAATFTTGLALERTGVAAAASVRHGIATLLHLGSNAWAMTWVGSRSDTAAVLFSAASITLGGVLDRVRVTADGTDTFDAGTINVLYEV
jgi:hypothetical protein